MTKYNIKNCVDALQEKIIRSYDKLRSQELVEGLGSIFENLDAKPKIMKSTPEDNGLDLNCIINIKDKQLRDQLYLIKILVVKLFNVDRGLEFLERRVSSVVRNIL